MVVHSRHVVHAFRKFPALTIIHVHRSQVYFSSRVKCIVMARVAYDLMFVGASSGTLRDNTCCEIGVSLCFLYCHFHLVHTMPN